MNARDVMIPVTRTTLPLNLSQYPQGEGGRQSYQHILRSEEEGAAEEEAKRK